MGPNKGFLVPSWVTLAYNSCEGIKVVGLQFGPLGRVGLVHVAGLPNPSGELGHVTWAKVRATGFLKWRAPREAGFTEQRKPPAHDGGRITSQRTNNSYFLVGRPWLNNHPF